MECYFGQYFDPFTSIAGGEIKIFQKFKTPLGKLNSHPYTKNSDYWMFCWEVIDGDVIF